MIKTGKFEVPYYIYKVQDHKDLKPILLEEIKLSSGEPVLENGEIVQKSDWAVNKDGNFFKRNFVIPKKSYYGLMETHLNYIINEIIPDKDKKNLEVGNGWYMQYNKFDHYSWHSHSGVRWAVVYYLELGPKGPITEFENFYGKSIIPEIEEGDIIIFPGWIKHKSPPVINSNRKTIIAFNIVEKNRSL